MGKKLIASIFIFGLLFTNVFGGKRGKVSLKGSPKQISVKKPLHKLSQAVPEQEVVSEQEATQAQFGAHRGRIVLSSAGRKVLDKIVARVNGVNILLSDLNQPRIEKGGEFFSIEEVIDNEILFQKAAQRKLIPTKLDLEKYIISWKEASQLMHLSEEEFEKRLRADGLTGKKYRNQLARILAIRNLRQLEVSERVVVTPSEVEDYYAANPEYTDNRYLLKTKIVGSSEKEKDVKWMELDWIDESDLAKKFYFVTSLKEGEISQPLRVEQGKQFIKLVKRENSRLKTLTESWGGAEKKLQEIKMKKFEKGYVSNLRKEASVVYLDKMPMLG